MSAAAEHGPTSDCSLLVLAVRGRLRGVGLLFLKTQTRRRDRGADAR
jgi:hypothetical protein